MRSIEKINDFKKVREIKIKHGIAPETETDIEKAILSEVKNKDAFHKRIVGLDIEDEFHLMSIIMADVEQITPLEQKQLKNYKKYTIPDFLISVPVPKLILKKEKPLIQRMFVDVKRLPDDTLDFVIPVDSLKKLERYSQAYTFPLYFAIKPHNKYYTSWLFVSSDILKKHAKIEKKKFRGKNQNCYTISILDILKINYMGLWFNDFILHVKKGTKVTKRYKKDTEDGFTIHEKYGKLVYMSMEIGDKKFEVDMRKSDIGKMVLIPIIDFFAKEETKELKNGKETELITEVSDNIMINFSELIVNTYYRVRRQFKEVYKDNDTTFRYYLNTFSDKDWGLVSHIHDSYEKLRLSEVFMQIRMLPEPFFPKDKSTSTKK